MQVQFLGKAYVSVWRLNTNFTDKFLERICLLNPVWKDISWNLRAASTTFNGLWLFIRKLFDNRIVSLSKISARYNNFIDGKHILLSFSTPKCVEFCVFEELP